MKLKDNLKNFAKYVAKSLNKFAEMVNLKKNELINKTNTYLDSKYSEQKALIKEEFQSFYERMRMIEYNLYNSGLNDIIVIAPGNKLDGKTHTIGDNSSSLKNCYDALPNNHFRYDDKPKYKNDDYMLLSSGAEKIEIPYFNCETKNLNNKFNQWINDEGLVVRNTGKLMTRNAHGVSMIHTAGLNPTSYIETKYQTFLEDSEIEIPHYDYSAHTVKLYVDKNNIENILPSKYISFDYNKDYLTVEVSDEWTEEDDGIYLSCIISIKIIYETYSYFDENEYVIIKTPVDNLALNVFRPKIYFNVEMFYSINGNEINIEELTENSTEGEIFRLSDSIGCFVRDFSDGNYVSESGPTISGLIARIETSIPKDKILNFCESTSSTGGDDAAIFSDAIEEEENVYRVPIKLSISSKEDDGNDRKGVILIKFSHKPELDDIKNNTGVKYNTSEERFLSADSPLFLFCFTQGKSGNEILDVFGSFKEVIVDSRGFLLENVDFGYTCNVLNKDKAHLFLKSSAYTDTDKTVLKDSLDITTGLDNLYFDKNIGVCKSRASILILKGQIRTGVTRIRNYISVFFFIQDSALIPGEEFVPVVSSKSSSYNRVGSVSFSLTETSKTMYIVAPNPLYDEQKTIDDETFDVYEKKTFQNWNPANFAEKVRFKNNTDRTIKYNALPPSAFDMFYKSTEGISFSVNKSKITDKVDEGSMLTVLPAATTTYTYPDPKIVISCERGKWAKHTELSYYTTDLLIFDKSSWSGEVKSGTLYKNKNFYSPVTLSINENFDCSKKNFVILKKYQSQFYPQSENGYVDPSINDVVFTFEEIGTQSDLLHMCDCLYVVKKNLSTSVSDNAIGPYDIGRFIINNEKFNYLNKSYFIKISEILTSKALISGMQESIAGSFHLDTSQIAKDLSLLFKIGNGDNSKEICRVDLNIDFNAQDEGQFGTITLWTSKHDSPLITTVRHHFSIESSTFKWNLFEGKQFDDEDECFIELSKEDIIKYGTREYENENHTIYSVPITIVFVGEDPSIVSQIIIKSYENIYI